MILSFMTRWGKDMPAHMAGRPTYFVEKIVTSLKTVYGGFLPAKYKPKDFDFEASLEVRPKLHTLRRGITSNWENRWKAGMDIHFYINTRTKNMFQFAPVMKVKSTQKISIIHDEHDVVAVFIDHRPYAIFNKKHGKPGMNSGARLQALAYNDGFDSVADFFAYFNTDFVGQIIHWTDLKYGEDVQ
jgi:hypothetical protein